MSPPTNQVPTLPFLYYDLNQNGGDKEVRPPILHTSSANPPSLPRIHEGNLPSPRSHHAKRIGHLSQVGCLLYGRLGSIWVQLRKAEA
jgi:hypothetical protein